VVTAHRGAVEQQVEGNWVPLKRGDIVPNAQMVRTLAGGHVKLQRNKEVVALGSNTQLRIEDDADIGYTTVHQDFGRVEVEAEHKLVKHFEVKTPYLAAVVKGTQFVVTSNGEGASVTVDRGSVAVQSLATERSTLITPGQTARVSPRADIEISGLGPWRPIVEPGVRRVVVTASAGSAMVAPMGDLAAAPHLQAPTAAPTRPRMTSGAPTAITGFVASGQALVASNQPAQPVNAGIVVLGGLFGALIGGIALLWRRAV
jgi:hypothetical protein